MDGTCADARSAACVDARMALGRRWARSEEKQKRTRAGRVSSCHGCHAASGDSSFDPEKRSTPSQKAKKQKPFRSRFRNFLWWAAKTPRGSTGLTTPMSAHESSSDESDDASASPARSDAGSPRRRRAGSGASNPGSSSRAARGLAFLRRDLARSVSRSATVDSIRPDAGNASCASSAETRRGTDALRAARASRLPSQPPGGWAPRAACALEHHA